MKTKANKSRKNKDKEINTENVTGNKKIKIISIAVIASMLIIANFQFDFDVLFPIKKIRAQGEFENVTEKMILDAITDDVNGGYLGVDVNKIKIKIEKLAWVKIASVRRVWPDSVVITIKEQKAHAVWKNGGLLNEVGEFFKPVNTSKVNLPVLSGPGNLNVKVMNEFKIFEKELKKIDLGIREFNLDERRAIDFLLSNNIKISLGRNQYKNRLNRFITAYKLNLRKYADTIEYIDMRYTNGFSVKWKDSTHAAKAENVLRGNLDV